MATQKNDREALGTLLRDARTAQGLSIRAAAREAGFSEGRWRQLEQGYELRRGVRIPANPKPTTVVQAADALNLDPQQLLDLAGLEADLETIRAEIAKTNEKFEAVANYDFGQSFELSEIVRLKALLRDTRETLEPYMDLLDAFHGKFESIKVDVQVLSRLAEQERLPTAIQKAIDDLSSTLAKEKIPGAIEPGDWLKLTRELIRMADNIDSNTLIEAKQDRRSDLERLVEHAENEITRSRERHVNFVSLVSEARDSGNQELVNKLNKLASDALEEMGQAAKEYYYARSELDHLNKLIDSKGRLTLPAQKGGEEQNAKYRETSER